MPSLQLQPDIPSQFRSFNIFMFHSLHYLLSCSIITYHYAYLHCKLQGISFTAEWPAALVVFEPFPPLLSFPAHLASDLLFQHVLVVALKESEASSNVSLMGMIHDHDWFFNSTFIYIRVSCVLMWLHMCYRSQGANLSKYRPLFRSQIVSRRCYSCYRFRQTHWSTTWDPWRCRGPRGRRCWALCLFLS